MIDTSITHTYYYGDWDTIPADIIDQVIGDTLIKIGTLVGGEGFSLWWSDGVANDWAEFYPHLSQALARMAVLTYAYEHDYAPMFNSTPDQFAIDANVFFGEVTS